MATATSARNHRLGLIVEIRSQAPLLKIGKRKMGKREDFVETENYALRFKFKNLEQVPFPSGWAHMKADWTVRQSVHWPVDIPQLEPGKEAYASFRSQKNTISTEEKSEAMASGFGFFCCDEIYPTNTNLASFDGATSYDIGHGYSVQSMKVTTWNTIYAKYSMIISAGALVIIALQSFIQLVSWAFSVVPPFLYRLWPCVFG